jgi:hypothetical protein
MSNVTVIHGQFPDPTPPARACGFCGEELKAIELWHSAENCSATRIGHANHVLEQLNGQFIAGVDRLMTRHYEQLAIAGGYASGPRL